MKRASEREEGRNPGSPGLPLRPATSCPRRPQWVVIRYGLRPGCAAPPGGRSSI